MSEEIIRVAHALWGVRPGRLKRWADFRHRAPFCFGFFCLFRHWLQQDIRYLFGKITGVGGGEDDKIKIVLFEYFIALQYNTITKFIYMNTYLPAFISILQYMVNWLKLF